LRRTAHVQGNNLSPKAEDGLLGRDLRLAFLDECGAPWSAHAAMRASRHTLPAVIVAVVTDIQLEVPAALITYRGNPMSDPCASIEQTLAFLAKQAQTVRAEIAKAATSGIGNVIVLEEQLRSYEEGIAHFNGALTQCRSKSKPSKP
jgi:hypothetical protein